MPKEWSDLESRLHDVEARIERSAEKSGRKRSEITLVAVTKKFSADAIRTAYAAGVRDFGENYVQEFAGKQASVSDLSDARVHLIGHLQSNKSRQAAQLFQVVETVDSPKLLQRLEAAALELGVRREAFLEIKLSDEESKTGASENELPALVEAAKKCQAVAVTGLMTVPPWSEIAEESRPYFRKLADLARRYGLSKLSMGMSGDFEVAVEEGATSVRVGTALFGPRPRATEPAAMTQQ